MPSRVDGKKEGGEGGEKEEGEGQREREGGFSKCDWSNPNGSLLYPKWPRILWW